jgi:hypothetical protein
MINVSTERVPEERCDGHRGKRTYPMSTKSTSDMTIMNSPTQMTPITPASVQVGRSSLNANANNSTKASDDDLHMAIKKHNGEKDVSPNVLAINYFNVCQ